MTTHTMMAKHCMAPARGMPSPRCPCPSSVLQNRQDSYGQHRAPGEHSWSPSLNAAPVLQTTRPQPNHAARNWWLLLPLLSIPVLPVQKGCTFYQSLISLSVISKKRKSLSALAALPVARIVLLHHHNSRPTAGRDCAHRLFLSVGARQAPCHNHHLSLKSSAEAPAWPQHAFPPGSRTS